MGRPNEDLSCDPFPVAGGALFFICCVCLLIWRDPHSSQEVKECAEVGAILTGIFSSCFAVFVCGSNTEANRKTLGKTRLPGRKNEKSLNSTPQFLCYTRTGLSDKKNTIFGPGLRAPLFLNGGDGDEFQKYHIVEKPGCSKGVCEEKV